MTRLRLTLLSALALLFTGCDNGLIDDFVDRGEVVEEAGREAAEDERDPPSRGDGDGAFEEDGEHVVEDDDDSLFEEDVDDAFDDESDQALEDDDDESFEEERDDDLLDEVDERLGDGVGATYGDPEASLRIQAIGDSHLAFNERRSTPAQLSELLAERGRSNFVQNNAVGGATIGCGGERGDNCIPPQYVQGDWTHVMVSAGGNDFLETNCSADLDAIISADLRSGLMVDLVERLRASGAQVIIVGYVELLNPDSWARCAPIETMLQRYRAFAGQTGGVSFVDTRDAFGREAPENYADDIHTSVAGSRRLAEHIIQRAGF